MEHKNFFLAMGLIAGFLILWSVFVIPRFAPPPVQVSSSQVSSSDEGKSLGRPEGEVAPHPEAELKSAHAEMGQPIVDADTVLRDENNEIVLSPRGGAVKNWRLKLKGQEVDLVLNPEADLLPLASFQDAAFKITIRPGIISTRRGTFPGGNAGGPAAIMETTLANGVHVTKTLALNTSGHLHQLSYRFHNPTGRAIELSKWTSGWGPGLGTAPGEMKENPGLIRAITLGKLKVHVIKKDEHPEFGRWAAIDNRYYLVAFIPKIPHPIELGIEGAKDKMHLTLTESALIPARGETLIAYDFYAGPKGYTQLKKYDRGLEQSVDFGTFGSLGRMILNALYYLKSKTGNYGVAIILLTIGIQTLMFPLTVKSFKATLSMKKLQPKIAELQARFKGDPKRLNIEMMNLYKSAGTNPFGGCLPMLLQLPIFLALFTTLRNAYELRGAPFYGWIHDLSVPDTFMQIGSFQLHALPLIMGGTMYFQQRMSGAISDPTQRQMMTMMPIMFTFMFYGFPAGLVLYWLTNNVMTMATQWAFQRFTEDPNRVIETTIVK